MKNLILTIGLITFGVVSAQNDLARTGDMLIFRNKAETYNISGTPYYPENYTKATVNDGDQLFDIRYNSFRDYMEYNKDGEILELVKQDNRKVHFINGDSFELKEYTNRKDTEEQGYLKLIASSGTWKFYERVRTYIYKSSQSNNGYQSGSDLDRFDKQRTEYYIEHNDKIDYVKKEKNLYKLFPELKDTIKEYIKKHDLDFEKPKTVQALLEALQKLDNTSK